MKKEIKEKTKGLFGEFKEFIAKGNVIDLAVGVIIGSAFGKIVTSVVDDLLMPVIGAIIGGLDFGNLSLTIGKATIRYGLFINNIINFIIIALCIFIIVKIVNKITKKKKEEPKTVEKSSEVILLEEIRDLLKDKK